MSSSGAPQELPQVPEENVCLEKSGAYIGKTNCPPHKLKEFLEGRCFWNLEILLLWNLMDDELDLLKRLNWNRFLLPSGKPT